MPKIVLGINSLDSIQYPAYSNHIQFMFGVGRRNPDVDICLVNPSRMSIDRMRNMAAKIAVEGNFDYLLFLDDDVLIPADALTKLLAADADIVAGDVIIRGYPFDHMCFRYEDESKRHMKSLATYGDEAGKVIDVDAVGFSLCLIKTSVLKKVPQPWFITGVNNTEDVYFCLKAREIDSTISIKVDTSITCSHILWYETINSKNKKDYTDYQTSLGVVPQTQDNGDREDDYAEMVVKVANRNGNA